MNLYGQVAARTEACRTVLLSRGRGVPLHRQIADDLRAQIDAGTLQLGDRLPSEHDLVRRYGVSRGTVRQALAALRAEGAIAGSQGRQLTVRGVPLAQPLGELISFSAWVRSLGKRPSGRVIAFGRETADEEVSKALRMPRGEEVFHLVRLRFADGEPLMVERTAFPAGVGARLAELDLGHESIYAELGRRGIVFASARHLIGTMPAGRVDAELLCVPIGAPLIRVYRHAFSPSGEPLEWSDDRYVERVNFVIENSAAVSGLARRLG